MSRGSTFTGMTDRTTTYFGRTPTMPTTNATPDPPSGRRRARSIGLTPGILPPGPLNALTDIPGVRVGHLTLINGEDTRTGATAIVPHGDNVFQNKVPAGLTAGNGYGKLTGGTQLVELGELETPIVLTNTLAVPRAMDAILDWTLTQPSNEQVYSVNAVVGETNDSYLNNIRRRTLTSDMIRMAIEQAQEGPIAEGAVGAGTGTVAFGWKGGIGTSSRRLPPSFGGYTVGVLVQTNFGGVLQMQGVPIGQLLGRYYLKDEQSISAGDGSIMMVIATDAPLSDRNLTRRSRRAFAGLARTGASMTNGSGDYAIAFSTAEHVRRASARYPECMTTRELPNEAVSPLFQATIEATEEAIYNSLCAATTVQGFQGRIVEALPLSTVATFVRSAISGGSTTAVCD